ncbi:MAG: tetratricopeptide repeat protein [Coriobacteriia bacterium]|nr:tetratricopeptide repeat protein [Coriobacteriia bacterium]
MNELKYQQAMDAYRGKDYATASILFHQVVDDGEPFGEVHHLRGNSLMRLGRFYDAVEAYLQALEDSSYAKRGAVASNLGKAHMNLNNFEQAAAAFKLALEDPGYKTRYKAFNGLGDAEFKLNHIKEAGVAYRNAALDGHNPDPSSSLLNLGICFMHLKRPGDAIESFRTTLDFNMDASMRGTVFENLGQAYVSAKRYDEAVNSFEQALDSPNFELSAKSKLDYENAKDFLRRKRQKASKSISATSDYLQSGFLDPLDPTGSSGVIMPSPDESGFFDITESDLVKLSKSQAREEARKNHRGLKIFLVFLLFLILIAAGLGFAFFKGYGYSTAKTTVESLFTANGKDQDISQYFVQNTDPNLISLRQRELARNVNDVKIVGIDRSTHEAKARIEVTLAEGGQVHYMADFGREGLGWKLSDIKLSFDSQS